MNMRNAVTVLVTALFCVSLTAATHVVKVNADGSFSPAVVNIASGDTVQWTFSSTTDSIIPISWNGVSAGYCAAVRPFAAGDANEFTGPMPQAASGTFVLSPLESGYVVEPKAALCKAGFPPKVVVGNEMLCRGGAIGATADTTWQDPNATGVFIRLLWKDIHIAPGSADSSFDFTVLDREVTKAVQNGKLYNLAVKAGSDGTPDWLFTNGVTPLRLQDSGSDGDEPGCGARLTLGNPTAVAYQNHYFDMLRAVARHLRKRADWYRALAYIKPSGANLFTHENRLPKRCETGCVCNSQLFAENGYTPSGVYAFYTAQTNLMAAEFPGKTMSYALIQDGFPRINDAGGYERSDGSSSNGTLPGTTQQTQTILNNGQAAHNVRFAVQHNGLGPKKTDGCIASINAINAPGCPNKWVLQEGLEGQVTGWQMLNEDGVANPAQTDSTYANAIANSQAVFMEIYEERFWEAVRQPGGVLDSAGSGKTMAQWTAELHARRRTLFPSIPDPLPLTHRHTFTGNQTVYYVHGAKCGRGNATPGKIVVGTGGPIAPPRRRSITR